MGKELTGEWQKSSRCAADSPQCVEARRVGDRVQVRDAAGAVATYSQGEWAAFVAGIRDGDF